MRFVLAMVVGLALAGAVRADPVMDDLDEATMLMAELQACLAGGLNNGGITPAPEDMATVRLILNQADPMLREATTLARKETRTPQETLLMTAWIKGSLAMLTVAEEYRLEHGY